MTLKRIIIAIVIVLVTAVGVFYMCRFVFFGIKGTRQQRVRLLYKTDHQALLEACRELSKQVTIGDLKTGTYWLHGSRRHPAVSRFPQAILDLAPNYVYIDENNSGRVMLEMHGGFVHFGVQAYTEDYKKPHVGFEYGDKKLIPGLWYHDDGYLENPEYEKMIEALRPKGK